MMKPLIVLLPTLLCLPALAETDPDVAAYSIPADAEKTLLPYPAWNNGQQYIYKRPNGNGMALAVDIVIDGTLVERQLWKEGKRHGVQRTWYSNGQVKGEEPYKNGVMDGIFKYWNERGQLIGRSEIKAGYGTISTFYDNGMPKERDDFSGYTPGTDLVPVSVKVSFSPKGKVSQLMCNDLNRHGTLVLNFYEDSALSKLSWGFVGPNIQFNRDGTVKEKKWGWWFSSGSIAARETESSPMNLGGRTSGNSLPKSDPTISEAEYAAKAAENPNLPPYYSDATRYKEFYTPELQALVKKYNNLPRVLIPLQLDEKGEPLLAPAPF